MTDADSLLFTVSSSGFARASHDRPTVLSMPDAPSTPAERITARSRRLRTAGIAGALAMLAAFSGLAAGRVATGDDHTATPAAAAPSEDGPGSWGDVVRGVLPDELEGVIPDGVVSPAAPSAAPDASSGAS
jgi:hypothetical protein